METGLLIPSGKSGYRRCEVKLHFSGYRVISPGSVRDAMQIGKHLACARVIGAVAFRCAVLRQLLVATAGEVAPYSDRHLRKGVGDLHA